MSDQHSLFLPCPRGLEASLVAEMEQLGSPTLHVREPVASGVPARGTLADVMLLNLHSRIASRVLLRMGRAAAAHADDVYRLALALPWERWFTPQQTLRVDVTAERGSTQPPQGVAARPVWRSSVESAQSANFPDSLLFAALRVKDGVCDHFRRLGQERPSVDRQNPDVRIHLHLGAADALLYLDTSGEALFKRGWRAEHGEAPLKENLAAGLVRLSGWTPQDVFFDPLCGAGTLAIEAAQSACRIASGLNRTFGFERLAGFDAVLWEGLREAARAMRRDAPAPIVASDIDPRMVAIAQANARLAGVEDAIEFKQADVMDAQPPAVLAAGQAGHIVTNPPYAERIEAKGSEADEFLPRLGDVLKRRFAGWHAGLLLADLHADRALRLKPTRRHVVYNGPIECRFFTFALVAGRPARRIGEVTPPAEPA